MSFGEPLWFWAFLLIPVLLLLFGRNEHRREKLLRQLVAARLQDRLAGNVSTPLRRLRFGLLLLAMACIIVSLAQPRLGYTWEQSKRKGRDVIIAIDCSRSMLATDLAPSRIMRAKLAVQDLIGKLGGDRVGLIAFAGSAFLQAPLTIDYGAVLNALTELDTDIIPRGGTNIAAAIKEADTAFGKGESDHRCLIVFTDGEELDADGVTAASVHQDRIRIFTVGLGSADGSLIPIAGQEGGTAFVKDEKGQIVKSRLDEERLRKIAEATGGFYVHLQNGPAEMQQIIRDGLGQMKEQEIDARMSRRPIERYQWPLAAGLMLLVASTLLRERKRVVRRQVMQVAAAFVFGWLMPASVEAKNRGIEAYERQDYAGAIEEFSRQLDRRKNSEALHFDLGAAAYKAGDFGKALEAFARAVTSPDPQLRAAAEYNLGNTLFQRGAAVQEKERKMREWKDALQHYDQALKIAPKNADAEYNRDVVRKLLEELEKEPPQNQQQQPQDQQQNKDDQQKDKQDQPPQQQPPDGQKQKEQPRQQQSQQQNQPSKESQGKQPKDQQPGKDQQSEGQDGQKDPDRQQKHEGKDDERKEAKEDRSQPGQDAPKDSSSEKQEQPAPSPEQTDKKREGEIQAQGEQPPGDPRQEAAAEAQAAQEGRMTEAQARNLLESLKSEDERVQLLKPGERRPGRVLRDW